VFALFALKNYRAEAVALPGFCSMNQVYSGKAAIFLEKSGVSPRGNGFAEMKSPGGSTV